MISVNTDKDIKYFQNKAILNFGDELKDFEGDYDLPYMFFGGFALFMSDLIKHKQESESLRKANLLIEEMAASKRSDVENLFMVGFIEVFSDETSSIEYSRKNFSKNSK